MAANLLRLRTARGLSTTQLANAVKELGQSIPATGITRIEKGERRVDVDDLIAFALALNVAPNALLLPPDWSDAEVDLVPEVTLSTRQAWLWAEGRSPASNFGAEGEVAVVEDDDDSEAEFWRQLEEYEALTNPPQRRRAVRNPANRAAKQVSDTIDALVTAVGAKDSMATAKQLKAAKLRMRQLEAELLRMELDLEAGSE
ncbi:helix-turn-helix transcriptional regulator [Streptomyces sp. CB03911]|uniref:helix-turn-helix domain-containing protein n=1 Tax=Streptomyces sp. CB03911 TaxID=1804758 RepID=UPI0009392B8B|nr:helix-turn-helix transcriptional regulator [Streptomyces sp. CB03911]